MQQNQENQVDQTQERLTNIEMKLAYMEDFVNQIQEVAVEQAKEIELLRKENKLMIII